MRKAGLSFLAGACVMLWACAGTAAAGVQAERARSAKPQVSQVSSGGDSKIVKLYPRGRTNGVSAAYAAALRGESSVPFIDNGRTMVPLRFLGEQLGAAVIRTDVGTIIVRQ